MGESKRRILLGHISVAHGIRGEVVLVSHTERPTDIAAYGPLGDEDGVRSFCIKSIRHAGKGLIASIEGIDNRTAAEALRGTRLYVDRSRLPPPGAGEWYQADLVGLAAVSALGEAVGEVVAVQNFGAGDILEIRPAAGGPTLLVPFEDAFVPAVEVAQRRIVIDLPAETPDDGELPDDEAE